MKTSLLLALSAGLLTALLPAQPSAAASARKIVAVKAGTIHVVDKDRVIEGGGTILIIDGKIVAVGGEGDAIAIPSDARIVDYGADAVIVPGFVAADSPFGRQIPAARTAAPSVKASDNFDSYASYASTVAGGVTSAYVPPSRSRLIAGQGAVCKLGGEPGAGRIVSDSATIHGSISQDARNTRGFWEPPVPATVDIGLGVALKQLPATTMGAVVALSELLELAGGGAGSEFYGPYAGPELSALLKAKRPWRMTAHTEPEIRALLAFFGERGLPLIIDGGRESGALAAEIAAAGIPVILEVPYRPGAAPSDRGKPEDEPWPSFDAASQLAAQQVPFAFSTHSGVSSLRFAARLASRGGLDPALALRAITLSPAEMLGVADRVGSLAPGRDADFVVLNGPPLDAGTNVIATWIDGEIVWKASETAATVISVDELHIGDGRVLSPGEVLLQDGVIAEVGRRVGHPAGSTVVRGKVAMPGIIDARGHLGLEGSTRVPAARFEFTRLVETADRTDRRVADAGITTVVLTPRGVSDKGTPTMAYKPAGSDLDRMVISDPTAMYLRWSKDNRNESGDKVRELLTKAEEYKTKWEEYHEAIAGWSPPPPEPPKEEEEKEGDEDEDAEEEEEDEDDEKDEDAAPKPVTGTWTGEVDDPAEEGAELRLRLRMNELAGGKLEGTLRCDAASEDLVYLTGTLTVTVEEESETDEPSDKKSDEEEESDEDDEDKKKKKKSKKKKDEVAPVRTVLLTGLGTNGMVTVEATVVEPPKPKKKKKKKKKDDDEEPTPPPVRKLDGKLTVGKVEIAFELEQNSEEYPVAKRPERRKEKVEKEKEPKGKPKPPSSNKDLDPLRRALEGEIAIVIEVNRKDEILDCVDAFESAGIKPILYGANDAHKVIGEIKGRIRGVILNHSVTYSNSRMGTRKRNRYAELQSAGIPVAFHSSAEEGASDLPVFAAYAVSEGMSPEGALKALTSDAAMMFGIDSRVGRLQPGLDADVLLLEHSPLEGDFAVERVWVNGREVRLN